MPHSYIKLLNSGHPLSAAQHRYIQNAIVLPNLLKSYSGFPLGDEGDLLHLMEDYLKCVNHCLKTNSIDSDEQLSFFLFKTYLEFRLNYNDSMISKKNFIGQVCKLYSLDSNKYENFPRDFFEIFCHKYYKIELQTLKILNKFIYKKWAIKKLKLVENKFYLLSEIESFYFTEKIKPNYFITIQENLERCFSSFSETCHIFLPSKTLNISQACQFIHELAHVFYFHSNDLSKKNHAIYEAEKFAVYEELKFLQSIMSSQQALLLWVEENFIFPLNELSRDFERFEKALLPFEHSLYCSSVLEYIGGEKLLEKYIKLA
ncbi:MAG: hypothetical protein K2X39_08660 [Silvanigrellaceae bacterium]|nr:hypothetical protein [Silvanigrellaceae bacterium]